MRKFLRQIAFFLILPLFGFIIIEYSLRQNSFKAKAEYIQHHKDSIELVVLGPSYTNRAINPEFIDLNSASLCHAGMDVELVSKLFDKYVKQLPRLDIVMIDMGYGTLEFSQPPDWNKNHLYWIYYDINLYQKKPPLRDYFMLTANPNIYLTRFLSSGFRNQFRKMNEFGFITDFESRFEKLNYDIALIQEQRRKYEIAKSRKDLNSYVENADLLNNMIQYCIENKIQVILLMTPNFYLYNQLMDPEILKRRDQFLEQFSDEENVVVWNYEKAYENDIFLFANENHLNSKGAETFTKLINQQLNELSK